MHFEYHQQEQEEQKLHQWADCPEEWIRNEEAASER